MSNITRSTPYLAPGAPKSPIVLAIAGLLVLLASVVASKLGFTLAADADTTAMVASALVTIVGLVQHRMARGEQADGAPKLAATIAAALAEPPPEPVVNTRSHLDGDSPKLLESAGGASPTIDAAAQLHEIDPSKRLGLDPWAGMALREILAGDERGAAGPIEWCLSVGGRIRVDIDGIVRWATPGDPMSVARAVGAERWLEVDGSVPAPRSHVPSNALLDDDGAPVSAGDLDSGAEEDADPDERTTERVAIGERVE